jgi:hypothetical protein
VNGILFCDIRTRTAALKSLHYSPLPCAMTLSRTPSVTSTTSSLPSYNATARDSTPPTYSETLSAPDRAFIAQQSRLLEGIKEEEPPHALPYPPARSNEWDIERLEQINLLAQQVIEANQPPPPMTRRNKWLTWLLILLVFALPFSIGAAHAMAQSLEYQGRDGTGCGKPTPMTSGIYFAISLPWLIVWMIQRTLRFKWHKDHVAWCKWWSLGLSLVVGIGYAVYIGVAFGTKYCRE